MINTPKQTNLYPKPIETDKTMMDTLKTLPPNAPISDQQQSWVSGFMVGLYAQKMASGNLQVNTGGGGKPILIAYGTQTGNAEGLAHDWAEMANGMGLHATVKDLGDVTPAEIAETERFVVVTSTYGDGEMPDSVQPLWEDISQNTYDFSKTNFSVLGLGDVSYDLFCQAAIDWNTRLAELGANRVNDNVNCDVDYEDMAKEWIEKTLPALLALGSDTVVGGELTPPPPKAEKPHKSKWTRKNPFMGKLKTKRILNADGSDKETIHYEIEIPDADMHYEVGDALGVIPANRPQLVDAIIAKLGAKPHDQVTGADGDTVSLLHALTYDYEIRIPNRVQAQEFLRLSTDADTKALADDKTALNDYLWGREIIDLLDDVDLSPQDFVAMLKKIQHRLYSISSSIYKHESEVHLTVASVRYDGHGTERYGVASCWLADCVDVGDDVPVFAHANKAFSVPEDNTAPMIMVGPGTGIAPFRAFLEEREIRLAKGAESGLNWLFFGDRHQSKDFLYQDELQNWVDSGLLKLTTAWSRDNAEKVYVQHRMIEQGNGIFEALEAGGYFFVCGDATYMAKDVEAALLEIIATHGAMPMDKANKYLDTLKKEKRYVRDVY